MKDVQITRDNLIDLGFIDLDPYLSLKVKDWKLQKKGFFVEVNHLKNGFKISLNNKKYFLRNRKSIVEIESQVICLPWILPVNKSELTLNNGAIFFQLKIKLIYFLLN